MREIAAAKISDVVAGLCVEANHRLPSEVMRALERAAVEELSPLGKETLAQLIENFLIYAQIELMAGDLGENASGMASDD